MSDNQTRRLISSDDKLYVGRKCFSKKTESLSKIVTPSKGFISLEGLKY
jgi:hypothetical protein